MLSLYLYEYFIAQRDFRVPGGQGSFTPIETKTEDFVVTVCVWIAAHEQLRSCLLLMSDVQLLFVNES